MASTSEFREFMEQLRARTDLVEVVGRVVQLSHKGKSYTGLCPFHSEKTPSFSVVPEKGFYHCFGCGVHGDAIKFLQETQYGGDFMAAVKDLAKTYGVPVPGHGGKRKGTVWTNTLEKALKFYRRQLRASDEARAYLRSREIRAKTADRFEIGYAPPQWNALKAVLGDDYTKPYLPKIGLVRATKEKRYDYFRGRLMFPIRGVGGELLGFGGRVLDDDDTPKYLNSPESPLFAKGRVLYGLGQALPRIRADRKVLVVEGYMDVVLLAQHGIDYAVATMGTAATHEHADELVRRADKIVFCFDSDQAGRRAARRAADQILPSLVDEKEISFLFLPDGEDPDSYVRANGPEKLEAMVDDAMSLADFLMDSVADSSRSRTSASYLKRAVAQIEKVDESKAPFLRLSLYKALSEKSGVGEDALREAAKNIAIKTSERHTLEETLPDGPIFRVLSCLQVKPELGEGFAEITFKEGSVSEIDAVRKAVDWLSDQGSAPTLADFFERSGNADLAGRLRRQAELYIEKKLDLSAEYETIVTSIKNRKPKPSRK